MIFLLFFKEAKHILCEHYLGYRSNVNDDLYLSPYPGKKKHVCMAKAGFEQVHAFSSTW